MMRFIAVVLLLFAVAGFPFLHFTPYVTYGVAQDPTKEPASVKILYLPFSSVLETQVTRDVIQWVYWCRFDLPSGSPAAVSLASLLREGRIMGRAPDGDIRLKVDGIESGPVYLSRLGAAYWKGTDKSIQLDEKAMGRVERLITGITAPRQCWETSGDEEF